ncbi:MAG: hypothetical protein Ta2B_00160 [Termitinemataceae bacterium]|nr:MAG: hypothetical protein Ta2B_00160 [Termitinemataceae bacterium]
MAIRQLRLDRKKGTKMKVNFNKVLILGLVALCVAGSLSNCANPMNRDFNADKSTISVAIDPSIKMFSINGPNGEEFLSNGAIEYFYDDDKNPSTPDVNGKANPDEGIIGKLTATIDLAFLKEIADDDTRYPTKQITFVPQFAENAQIIMDSRLYDDFHQALLSVMPMGNGNNPGIVEHFMLSARKDAASLEIIQTEILNASENRNFNFDEESNYMAIKIAPKSKLDPFLADGVTPNLLADPDLVGHSEVIAYDRTGSYTYNIYSVSADGHVAQYELFITVQTNENTRIVADTSATDANVPWTSNRVSTSISAVPVDDFLMQDNPVAKLNKTSEINPYMVPIMLVPDAEKETAFIPATIPLIADQTIKNTILVVPKLSEAITSAFLNDYIARPHAFMQTANFGASPFS